MRCRELLGAAIVSLVWGWKKDQFFRDVVSDDTEGGVNEGRYKEELVTMLTIKKCSSESQHKTTQWQTTSVS